MFSKNVFVIKVILEMIGAVDLVFLFNLSCGFLNLVHTKIILSFGLQITNPKSFFIQQHCGKYESCILLLL